MDPKDVLDEGGKAVDEGKRLYGIAETKVDSWFIKNPYTVLILTGVAVALVTLLVKSTFLCS